MRTPGSSGGPRLRLVEEAASPEDDARVAPREVDWSILMARAQRGDSGSYSRLLEETLPYLRSLARRRFRVAEDVEDAVQDVLVTVHAIRATYDPSRPFAPWLVAIANRRFVDQLRRLSRRSRRELSEMNGYKDYADPGVNIEGQAEQRTLHAAVGKLPPGQQQAIRLLKLQELSLKEASDASGLSISALKVATHRAILSLKRALNKGQDL